MADVFYCAVGRTYLDLAEMSAASLRRHNRGVRITVFTDQTVISGLFDAVVRIPTPLSPHALKRAKLEMAGRVRAERGLILDCDTFVTGDLGPVFDLLDLYDIAAAYDARWLNVSGTPLGAYVNAGVIAFTSNARVDALWRSWAEHFDHAPRTALYGGLMRDQPALEQAIHASGVRMFVLSPEYNLRANEFIVPMSGPVRVIHAITPMLKGTVEALADFLNSTTEGRCYFPLTQEMAVREVIPAGDGDGVRIVIRTERFAPSAAAQPPVAVPA